MVSNLAANGVGGRSISSTVANGANSSSGTTRTSIVSGTEGLRSATRSPNGLVRNASSFGQQTVTNALRGAASGLNSTAASIRSLAKSQADVGVMLTVSSALSGASNVVNERLDGLTRLEGELSALRTELNAVRDGESQGIDLEAAMGRIATLTRSGGPSSLSGSGIFADVDYAAAGKIIQSYAGGVVSAMDVSPLSASLTQDIDVSALTTRVRALSQEDAALVRSGLQSASSDSGQQSEPVTRTVEVQRSVTTDVIADLQNAPFITTGETRVENDRITLVRNNIDGPETSSAVLADRVLTDADKSFSVEFSARVITRGASDDADFGLAIDTRGDATSAGEREDALFVGFSDESDGDSLIYIRGRDGSGETVVLDTARVNVDMTNRGTTRFWIEYDDTNNELKVFISGDDTKPDEAALSVAYDLASRVGDDGARFGLVGSGSGEFEASTVDITDFRYTQQDTVTQTVTVEPEASAGTLSASGLATLEGLISDLDNVMETVTSATEQLSFAANRIDSQIRFNSAVQDIQNTLATALADRIVDEAEAMEAAKAARQSLMDDIRAVAAAYSETMITSLFGDRGVSMFTAVDNGPYGSFFASGVVFGPANLANGPEAAQSSYLDALYYGHEESEPSDRGLAETDA